MTHALQSLIWPEPGLSTERDLYVLLTGPVGLSMTARELRFVAGGTADFGTYFNIFNTGKWHKHCALEDLSLRLGGEGTFELVVFHGLPEQSYDRLVNEVITLRPDEAQTWQILPPKGFENRGLVWFALTALGEGKVHQVDWQTAQSPQRTPDLMLSVTTFRREAAVERTAARFADWVERTPLKDRLHLTVVDNGQSADIAASDHVTVVPNENLGGSGGFARGLLEARRRGASHCLFMDDDAAIHMEALERTWTFLSYATDPDTAVAAALANAQHRYALWENGALFHYYCRAQYLHTDLRDPLQVQEMEFATTATPPRNFYGGWWFFAFPVAAVKYMPFPFFVRGDDVSFGLMHEFNTVTLPGVLSFQDENFANKESLQTRYLDLRSHLTHHVAVPHMEIGRRRLLRIVAWFTAYSLFQCLYETVATQTLAFEDFMAGPEFFAVNADMAQRRADIAAMRDVEAWKDGIEPPRPLRRRINPDRWLVRQIMILSLNGHLLPFFSRWGDRVVLDAGERNHLHKVWGAAEVTFVDAQNGKHFTTRHSKTRAARELWRLGKLSWRFWRDYEAIKRSWRDGYPKLASEAWWTRRLGISAPARPAEDKEKRHA